MDSVPPDDPYLTLRRCTEALTADPADPHLWVELGCAQEAIGAILDALVSYQRALQLFLDEGALLDAARTCDKILAIDPNHQLALEKLSQLSSSAGARSGVTAVGREVSLVEAAAGAAQGLVGRVPAPSLSASSVREADIVEERSVPQEQPSAASAGKRQAAGGGRTFGTKQPISTVSGHGQGKRTAAGKREPDPIKQAKSARDGAPAVRAAKGDVSAASEAPPQHPVWLPAQLIAAGTRRELERNEVLCREHEEGETLVLLESGRLELAKRGHAARRVVLERLQPGAIIGEQALLGDGKWHITAKALEPAVARLLPRDQVLSLLGRDPEAAKALRRLYRDRLQQGLLKTSQLLRNLPPQEALTFLRRCKPLGVKGGQIVVEQGAPATGFFLVLLGELTVTMMPKKGGEPLLLGVLRDGDFFGEIALIYNQPATATLRASGFAQLLHLPAGEFHRIASASSTFLPALEAEARRRERDNRAIMRGAAYFDEQRGSVKRAERPKGQRR